MIERALHHELIFNQHLGNKSARGEPTKNEADETIEDELMDFWKMHGESARPKMLKITNSCFSKEDMRCIQRTLN